MTDPVAAALRGLPSHGCMQGMFGRRDRCLLVLSQLAGVPYQVLAMLAIGDIAIANGAATITTRTDNWTAAKTEHRAAATGQPYEDRAI